jgi:hypothetical protein
VVVAAVITVLVDPHSLSCADALHRSSLEPHGHAPGALACDGQRCTRTGPYLGATPRAPGVACAWLSSDALRRPLLACRSHGQAASPPPPADDTDSRCRGALWDRAFARDDSVFAM